MHTDHQLSARYQLVPADPDVACSFVTICSAVF